MQIDVINFKKEDSNKRKRLKETFFNSFALEENKYLNINYIFLEKLNLSIYLSNISLDNYKILSAAD